MILRSNINTDIRRHTRCFFLKSASKTSVPNNTYVFLELCKESTVDVDVFLRYNSKKGLDTFIFLILASKTVSAQDCVKGVLM